MAAAFTSAAEVLEKVLEDDEVEEMGKEDEDEEIEEVETEYKVSLLAETLKQCIQKLGGKELVNSEYFVNASVEMLVPLYDQSRN